MTKTVLIADDDAALRQALAVRCKQMGLQVIECATGPQAFQDIVQMRPDLMILDVGLPGADGLSLLDQLQHSGEAPLVPVVILTGRSDERTVELCRQLGAHYLWKGLDTWSELKTLICRLLQCEENGQPRSMPAPQEARVESCSQEPRSPRVLVIDDDPAISKAIQIRLGAHRIEVLRAFNGMQGYWMAMKELPDVVVTDYRMPNGQANTVIGRMKDYPPTSKIPIFVLTGWKIADSRDYGLERDLRLLGADEYLQKPIEWEKLFAALSRYVQLDERFPVSACRT